MLIEDEGRFSLQDPVTDVINLREIVHMGVKVVFLKTAAVCRALQLNSVQLMTTQVSHPLKAA